MIEIQNIFKKYRKFFIDDVENITSENQILEAENQLNFIFPEDYKIYCLKGGLNFLRVHHDILSPKEIVQNFNLTENKFIPFASNGCGDLYGWSIETKEVVFWDHETNISNIDNQNFLNWLKENIIETN